MPEAESPSRSFAELSMDTQIAINEKMQGVAMKRLTVQRKSSLIEFNHSGLNKPATVINFNPVPLNVCDGNVPWTIPAATDGAKKGIKVSWADKKYVGAFMTCRDPKFIAWPTDVKKPAADDENAIAEYKPVWLAPIELMNQYKLEYTDPSKNMMGGVLVFEGDIHAFEKSRGTLRIPKFERLADGRLSYFSEEVELQKELAACFTIQKDRCMFMIRQGDEYNQDETQKKNITGVHRAWDKFAIDMGWKEQPANWTSSIFSNEESCKGCGKARKRADAWFCDNCKRPFNALAAFLAGEDVPEAYLYALKDKDLELAMTEMNRREKIRASFRPKSTGKNEPPPAA